MVTGYLQAYKLDYSKQYFRPLIILLFKYVMISILITISLNYRLNIQDLMKNIFWDMFNFNSYRWYMHMYFILYLMIPFLNNSFHNFKYDKRILMIILVSIITLPVTLQLFLKNQ